MHFFTFLTRQLRQRFSATVSSTVRLRQKFSNVFIPTFRYRGNDNPAHSSLKWSGMMKPKRSIATNSERTTTDSENFEKPPRKTYTTDSESFEKPLRKTYTNRYGEEIMFEPCKPPLGYVYVPAGNKYLTRRCRECARKVYAVYCSQSRGRLATQQGLYVPQDAFEEAYSDFEATRKEAEDNLWQTLDKRYAGMPIGDKIKIYRSIAGRNNNSVTLRISAFQVHEHICHKYTPFGWFQLQRKKRTKAMERARRRVKRILASWVGEESGEKKSRKSK